MYDEDYTNGYGGFISFDDDICLFQGSGVPVDIDPYND